ncbi:hypothetical protein [Leptospirillum ferriphilum]|uniref:hypothetical protein n=1 Tax=Leptospirillum ferriphilum TaxID=178606 RepID=UPI000AA71546|nr:hypothetical protein [Leptospirillum ferriphilum]
MKKAFHPKKDQQITVQTYLSEFGSRLGPDNKPRNRPNPRCPACLEPMTIYGENRPQHDQVFSHLRNENPAPCPLRNSADHKYDFLDEAPQNSETGKSLRQDFFKNWEKHWEVMRTLLHSFMDVKDFISLIHEADRTRLWNRAKLSEWEIPYIFLVRKEWPPVKNKRDGTVLRKEWIRFWFDSRVRTLEDIWIRTQGTPRIIKARYSDPERGGVPGLNHLIDTDVIEIDTNLLESHHKKPHVFVIDRLKQAFPKELAN